MQPSESKEPVSFGSLAEELKYYWALLPDRYLWVGLLVAWALLFQFFGWTSALAAHSTSLFQWMYEKWDDVANDASHGKLIPWVVLGLLWWRRKELVKNAKTVWWPALLGLALMLFIHIVGYMVQQPRISMIALFGGGWILTGLVWGKKALGVTFFPFVIFAFCVPMGGTFAQGLTLPLRMFASSGAYCITHGLLDVNVSRMGTKLFDPNGVFGNFDVAAECSGIRSFVALLCITTIFAVISLHTWWKRAIMLLATIPLALFCNILRVSTIVLAANAFKTQAAGQFVDRYFGYFTYAIAIGGMFLLGWLLKEKPKARAA